MDPLAVNSWLFAACAAWFDGRLAAAVTLARRAAEMDPHNFLGRWIFGYALALVGRYDAAQTESVWLTQASHDSPYSIQLCGLIEGLTGNGAAARETLARASGRQLNAHEMFPMAEAFAAAGETMRALEVLESAVTRGFYPLEFIQKHNPLFAPLRAQTGFARIVQLAAERHRHFSV